MAKKIWGKVLVCGIIILFIGTSSIPSTETMTKQSEGSKHLLNERAPTISQPLSVLTTRLALQNQQRDIAFCYACNVVANPPYWFSSDDEYLAPCILPNFPSGSDIDSEGNLYAVDYGGGIYQIFYDGYQVFVAASIAFNSLTYDPESGLWYACDMTYLYTVNMTTGTSTVVGPLNVPNTIIGIACNLAGEMYGYDVLWTGDSTLYSIDKDTGACIAIGDMGYGFVYSQDCCFDRDNDILYIAGYFNDGSPPALLICDVTTGQCTIVGPFSGGMEVDALTFPYGVSNWTLYPRANYTWAPPIPNPGVTIFFNASTSHDDDGYITLYEWDWDNDSVYEEAFTIPTTAYLWASPGNYNVTLRVTDDEGLTATKSHIVEVIWENHPPAPPRIYGPENGITGEVYSFNTDTITDPDGDSLFCFWDWGDGNNTGWLGPYPSGVIISASHVWFHRGVYEIRVKLKDSYGLESNWSEPHVIVIVDSQPPEKPIIKGPAIGRVGVAYNFTVSITDPEAEQFYFLIEWGDGYTTGWIGPYDSGEEVILSHAWSKVGTYSIQVKAKNPYSEESNSYPFAIQIVELRKSLVLGVFHNQSETNDLRIIDTNFLLIVPSYSIVYSRTQLVISKEYHVGFLLRSFVGGVFEAALLLE